MESGDTRKEQKVEVLENERAKEGEGAGLWRAGMMWAAAFQPLLVETVLTSKDSGEREHPEGKLTHVFCF